MASSRGNRFFPFFLVSVFFLFFILIPGKISRNEFSTFRVVIDPGHGGQCLSPRSEHGDRYDSLSGTYLDDFREGAARGRITEQKIVFDIAQKVEIILKNAAPGEKFSLFEKVLRKYTDEEIERINIITMMSRGEGISRREAEKTDDPNGPYRLFDYPDKTGKIRKGRISRINEFRPQLVVSLHLAGSAPNEYKGMNPVLAAPYSMLYRGLEYLKGNVSDRKFFKDSPLSDWFCESTRRSPFRWFLSDTSMYFTGYPLDRRNRVRKKRFKGYRHNMIHWAYRDDPGWEKKAAPHYAGSPYSPDYRDVVPSGRFWDRERSKYESYRRDGGDEGFGGDNAYASYEIIRYILYSLKKSGDYRKSMVPGKSYVSIWIMPMHVNAINAFIELGYLNRRMDRHILLNRQDEIAEGVAVGIYSLLAGMKTEPDDFKYTPRGKSIDLEKYRISNDRNYFNAVWDK